MTDADTARTPPGSAYYLDRPLRSLAEVTAARDLCDVAAEISEAMTLLQRLVTGLYEGYAEGTDTATLVRAAVHDMRQARGRLDGLIDELTGDA